MEPILKKAPMAHQKFLEKLETLTRRDPRLLGVAISGSVATGHADEQSDLDLQIVVEEKNFDEIMRERFAFTAQFGAIASQFTGEHVGEPRLVIVLFEEELLHVDFKFITLPAFADQRVEDPLVLWERETLLSDLVRANPRHYPDPQVQWIEDRFWVWIHFAATKIKRGETLEALDALSWIRSMSLAPMVRAAEGKKNRAYRFLERDLPHRAEQLLKTHAASTSKLDLKRALEKTVYTYLELREEYSGALARKENAEVLVRRYVGDL